MQNRLAILVAVGSKADAHAGHLLSGNQGVIVQDLLGRCGVGWESCRVFAILDQPASRNDAEGMEVWFDSHEWGSEPCGWCLGTGGIDSGASNPDGSWITLPCPHCDGKKPTALQGSISRCRESITAYAPTMVLALGGAPLHLLREGNVAPRREKAAYVYPNSISDWRGSLFESEWAGCKALATYHPTWLVRDWSLQAYSKADAKKCASELNCGPELTFPKRNVIVLSP